MSSITTPSRALQEVGAGAAAAPTSFPKELRQELENNEQHDEHTPTALASDTTSAHGSVADALWGALSEETGLSAADAVPTPASGHPWRCKNLLVRDKAAKHYLLVAPESAAVVFTHVRRELGAKRSLSMVKGSLELAQLLPGVVSGMVSPLALGRIGADTTIELVLHPALLLPPAKRDGDVADDDHEDVVAEEDVVEDDVVEEKRLFYFHVDSQHTAVLMSMETIVAFCERRGIVVRSVSFEAAIDVE